MKPLFLTSYYASGARPTFTPVLLPHQAASQLAALPRGFGDTVFSKLTRRPVCTVFAVTDYETTEAGEVMPKTVVAIQHDGELFYPFEESCAENEEALHAYFTYLQAHDPALRKALLTQTKTHKKPV